MREVESASGIDIEEPSETEILIEELISREAAAAMSMVSSKKGDRGMAEDGRQRALERLGETRKRMSDEGQTTEKGKRKRMSSSNATEFLKERYKMQQQLKEEELKIRKEEHNLQKQQLQQNQAQQQQLFELVQQQTTQMHSYHEQAQQQQQQQNQLLLQLCNKLLSK